MVVAVVVILVTLLVSNLSAGRRKGSHISCANNVKQVGLAFKIWGGDHGNKMPMEISITNGGSMELATTGNVAATFLLMSNELSTPKVLLCPMDADRIGARFFSRSLANSNISYFIGLDARSNNPAALLSGDCNFAIGGVSARPGLLLLATNDPVAWISGRHTTYKRHFWDATTSYGNICLADGSIQQTTSSSRTNLVEKSTGTLTMSLTSLLQATSLATNRLAIP